MTHCAGLRRILLCEDLRYNAQKRGNVPDLATGSLYIDVRHHGVVIMGCHHEVGMGCHHAVVMRSSCGVIMGCHHAVIMGSSWGRHVVIIRSSCGHHVVIMWSSCGHHGSSCGHHGVSSRGHHAVIMWSSSARSLSCRLATARRAASATLSTTSCGT